jgi:hypothetical protein
MADGTTMDACARLHRMLSDMSGALLPSRRRPVVLAGDLNISTQWSHPARTRANVDAAFARHTRHGPCNKTPSLGVFCYTTWLTVTVRNAILFIKTPRIRGF